MTSVPIIKAMCLTMSISVYKYCYDYYCVIIFAILVCINFDFFSCSKH